MSATAQRREQAIGIALLAPTVLLFGLLILYPMLQSFWLSLHRTNTLTQRHSWVGLDNYAALAADPAFWTSFLNTLIWTGGAVVLQLAVGVGVALLLHGSLIGRAFARPWRAGFVISMILEIRLTGSQPSEMLLSP